MQLGFSIVGTTNFYLALMVGIAKYPLESVKRFSQILVLGGVL